MLDSNLVTLDTPREGDAAIMATCLSKTGEAPLISNLSGTVVSGWTVQSWFQGAVVARLGRVAGQSVAMGTLSRQEADLDPESVEVCHVFVAPRWRRQYKASQLVLQLLDEARSQGYRRALGRVVPENVAGRGLLASLRWAPARGPDGSPRAGLVWYETEVRR